MLGPRGNVKGRLGRLWRVGAMGVHGGVLKVREPNKMRIDRSDERCKKSLQENI